MEAATPKKHVWDKNNNWTEELNLLKEIIAKTELIETTKWGGPVYVLNGKNVIGIGGFKSYFGIWFYNGVFLKDDSKELVNAQEGVTKSLRQWRFNTIEEVNEKKVLAYIVEAIENEKAGKISKPTTKKTVISVELQEELNNNDTLAKAMTQFSLAKQREFHEYIEEAKREATKLTRIEKIKPMILDGIGLNDRYK
ncbi:YdeI/OmpD-associated family protein [Flavobacterium sp. W21_SRS_FM7]|uniref:YdeI/OmpD-associated family protein n=2 Tax=unclassified Flavobacterium TaxID=196869 RepID=UPI003F938196